MGSSYTTEIAIHAAGDIVIAAGSVLWRQEADSEEAPDMAVVSLYPNGEVILISKSALNEMAPGPYTDPPETEPAIQTGPDA
jgi:hypothetical protein